MAGDMEALQKLTKGIDKSAKKRKKKGKAPKPKQWEKLKLNRDKLGEILTREVDGNPAEQNKFKRNVQALVDANAEYKKAEGAFKDSVINTLVSFGTPLPSEKEDDDDHHDTSHGPADPEKPPPFECSLTYFITMFQRQIHWMQENSLPLLFGVIIAMILANTVADDYDYYLGGGREVEPHHVVDHIVSLVNATDSHGDAAEGGHLRRLSAGGKEVFEVVCISFFGHAPSLRFVANDLVICFFFGIAAKEITESVLPGGSLNPLKKAATPLIATLGGVLGPIVVYFCLVPIFNAAGMFQGDHDMATLYNGWGIVTATDIALAWVVAKKVFGEGHPAIGTSAHATLVTFNAARLTTVFLSAMLCFFRLSAASRHCGRRHWADHRRHLLWRSKSPSTAHLPPRHDVWYACRLWVPQNILLPSDRSTYPPVLVPVRLHLRPHLVDRLN
jgi:hypothetical protein